MRRLRPGGPRRRRKAIRAAVCVFLPHLERITQVVEPDIITCPCGCGEMTKIGEDRSERLDVEFRRSSA